MSGSGAGWTRSHCSSLADLPSSPWGPKDRQSCWYDGSGTAWLPGRSWLSPVADDEARDAQPTEPDGRPAEDLPAAEGIPLPAPEARDAQPAGAVSLARGAQSEYEVLPFPVPVARGAQPSDTRFLQSPLCAGLGGPLVESPFPGNSGVNGLDFPFPFPGNSGVTGLWEPLPPPQGVGLAL